MKTGVLCDPANNIQLKTEIKIDSHYIVPPGEKNLNKFKKFNS